MPFEAFETLAEIRAGMKMLEFASLPAIVKTAQNLSKKVDSMTNYELASVISKDPFATAKVLDLANKGGAQRVSLTKLEDAILKAGYSKVKQIAFGLLDMESAKEKLRHPEQEEAAAIGLCSCFVAEELMAVHGNYEAQEAFTSVVLRNYGKILLSAYMIEPYREALISIPVKGEDGAFRGMFGLTPLELTYELLSDSKLPKELLRTMKPLDPLLLEEEMLAVNKTDELIIFSEYTVRLTRLIFDYRLGLHKFNRAIKELNKQFELRFEMTKEQIYDVMACLDGDLRDLEEKYDIEAVPPGIIEIIQARVNEEDPPKKFTGSGRKRKDIQKQMKPEEIIQAGVNSIMSICSKKQPSLEKIYNTTLNTLRDGLKLSDCVCFIDDEGKGVYQAAYGVGDMFKHLKGRIKLDKNGKDIFSIILKNESDALVFDTTKKELNKIIPIWVSVDNINSMLVIYCKEMDPPFVIVAMQNNKQPIQLPGLVMKTIGKLRYEMMKVVREERDEKEFNLNFRKYLGAIKEYTANGKI